MKNRKSKFLLIHLKDNLLSILFVLFTICLVIFSRQNLYAAKDGLSLFANSVVPSLLPFFIATELLSHTNVVQLLGKMLNRVMRPLFNVPGEGAFAFVMGIISGYPVGAKIVNNFLNNGICTKEEAERLLAFTNNSGPLFIIGTVGISLFGNTEIGFLLLLTHILSCITVGIIFRFWKYNSNTSKKNKNIYIEKNYNVDFKNLGEILSSSITNSINTVVVIGGFVMLFSVIISILSSSNILNVFEVVLMPIFNLLHIPTSFISVIITGIIELTNGVSIISSVSIKNISISIIVCAFLLGFGGVSVFLQVFSIVSKSNISIKPYIIGKLLQGTIAAFYTYLLIQNFSIFNFDIY